MKKTKNSFVTLFEGRQAKMRAAIVLLVFWISAACTLVTGSLPVTHLPESTLPGQDSTTVTSSTQSPGSQTSSTQTPDPTQTPASLVPNFDHIILIVLENHNYQDVIGNSQMPYFNSLANQYVLLTQYFAVTHPSLPNYIVLASGSRQGITSDCTDCFVNKTNLADRIEASGRTWKSYQEDMPSPCTLGNSNLYAQKHNPFIYFDSIRLDAARCNRSIVPLTDLETDLAVHQLPNFAWIQPNLCHTGHDCGLDVVDEWLKNIITLLQASPEMGQNSLIIITFDEANGNNDSSCCGMAIKAGGQVAAVLISPLARTAFQDSTPYSHFSLLKTILLAWSLPALGQTDVDSFSVISDPWRGSDIP
jgi:phosphatidylinositol-3-phosphatase